MIHIVVPDKDFIIHKYKINNHLQNIKYGFPWYNKSIILDNLLDVKNNFFNNRIICENNYMLYLYSYIRSEIRKSLNSERDLVIFLNSKSELLVILNAIAEEKTIPDDLIIRVFLIKKGYKTDSCYVSTKGIIDYDITRDCLY